MRKKWTYLVLILLLALTGLQSFMLVSYHSTGKFFPQKKDPSSHQVIDLVSFEDYLLESYVLPFEITMTGGEGLSVHKVQKEEDGYFFKMWKDTLAALKTLSDTRQYEIYEEEKWNEITPMAGYLVKFNYDCPITFINWISNSINTNFEIDTISKIKIIPSSNDEGDVYLRVKDKVFRYVSVKLSGLLRQNDFLNVYEEIKAQSNITYVYLTEVALYESYQGNIEPDTTIVIDDNLVKLDRIRISNYNLLSECMLNLQLETDLDNVSPLVGQYIEEIKERLFGIYADMYKTLITQNKEVTFSDQYNVYTIHTDASISYRYSSAVSYTKEKGEISQAFLNALQAVEDLQGLSYEEIKNNLFLVDIEEDTNYYTFYLTYSYKDYPVYIKDKKASISISATEERVVSIDGIMLDIEGFFFEGEDTLYSLSTFSILSQSELALSSIKADNMFIAYIKEQTTLTSPSWILFDKEILPLSLEEVEQ